MPSLRTGWGITRAALAHRTGQTTNKRRAGQPRLRALRHRRAGSCRERWLPGRPGEHGLNEEAKREARSWNSEGPRKEEQPARLGAPEGKVGIPPALGQALGRPSPGRAASHQQRQAEEAPSRQQLGGGRRHLGSCQQPRARLLGRGLLTGRARVAMATGSTTAGRAERDVTCARRQQLSLSLAAGGSCRSPARPAAGSGDSSRRACPACYFVTGETRGRGSLEGRNGAWGVLGVPR